MNHRRQRQTRSFDTPARRMISAVPQPSAEARTITARPTRHSRLLRSASTVAIRSRSAALTSRPSPSRLAMAKHRLIAEGIICFSQTSELAAPARGDPS